MIDSLLTATQLRSRLFEILNFTVKGREFVIEKDGRPAARLVPYTGAISQTKKKTILKTFRSAFAKTGSKKPWSVLETSKWKEKERNYLKDLS